MSNYSDQILLSLLELSNKMAPIQIIKCFGNGVIDQKHFISMMRSLNKQIPQVEVEDFYLSTLIKFEASAISSHLLNELLLQARLIFAKQNKQIINTRSPNEIFYEISKIIKAKNHKIAQIFLKFDSDQDNVLNEKEFKMFLEFYLPISLNEFIKLKSIFPTQGVTLYNLIKWMQINNKEESNIQIKSASQSYPSHQIIKKKRAITLNTQEPQNDLNAINILEILKGPQRKLNNQLQSKLDKSQNIYQEKLLKQKKQQQQLQEYQLQQQQQYEQKQQQDKEQQEKQQYEQQQQQQEKQEKQQKLQDSFNKSFSQESNLYEDPAQESILCFDIKFKSFVVLDYNIPDIQTFLQQFNESIRQKQIFTDYEFPANAQSLGSELTQFQWKRLGDIWPTYEVFVENKTLSRFGLGKWISPKDICQGQLGDCYFLSVLSSLASRWPDFLLDLFITQKRNQQGIYSVRLCIDGIWKAIILDDYVPTLNNEPAFSSSQSKEVWVLLLEKAWAKSFGSYTNIISGNSIEVISSLTGGPAWSLKTNQPDFKEQFIGQIKRKCLMTTGTFSKTTNSEIMGLISDHAYSILKIRVIQHPSQGEVTLIKLRNPWGKKEWTGEWCDDSSSWTKEIKQRLRVSEKAQDGIFYMSYKDFINYFNTIYVGYFKKNYIYTSQSILSKSNKSIYFIFNNDMPGQYYFSAQQQSSRHFKDKQTNYEYSSIRMIFASQTNQGYEFKYAKYEKDQQVCIGEYFDKGKYILQVKINWQYLNEDKFVISVYGPKQVELQQIQKDQKFMSEILLNLALQNPNKEKKEFPNLEIISQFPIQYGIGYEYYKNTGSEFITVNSIFSKIQGLKLKKPERGNQYEISLKPYSKQLIAYSIQAEGFEIQQQRLFSATR